jgi:Pyridoxamine 5'-phosphate oxidase
MVTIAELDDLAPTIAAFLTDRIDRTGLCFLGTIRADGWPRVSPLELFVAEGRLYMGSMPNAVKARDLQRDSRCCLITPLADKDDHGGEVKAFCRAREVDDATEWEAARAAFLAKSGIDMGAPGGAHLFAFDIEGAAWQRVEGDTFRTTSWNSQSGVRELIREGVDGESVEL